ncbi:MAG TPA: HAD hydrolase family protein [Verrucomicrobiae bacterium]|nr:HAD hydrolase family protein [Verrucomicrobiae bacterium]
MPPPIQLISTDFDGTIFAEFENPPIAREFQELIAELQADGAKWVINTGRDMSSLMETLARAKVTIQPDYLVLVEREIQVHDGVRYAGLEEWNSACTRAHEELFVRVREDVPRIADWINARFQATVYSDPYSPFCLIAGNNKDADVINAFLETYCRSIPNLVPVRNDVYVRFSHAAFNKGTALAELSRRLGIGAESVFAAGDHLNDLPMLNPRFARWLGGPRNAIPSVKHQLQQHGGLISDLPHACGTTEVLRECLQRAGAKTPDDSPVTAKQMN